ncbi:MAG: hypothetical protein Q9202_004660 [Teloschistes flavicans]
MPRSSAAPTCFRPQMRRPAASRIHLTAPHPSLLASLLNRSPVASRELAVQRPERSNRNSAPGSMVISQRLCAIGISLSRNTTLNIDVPWACRTASHSSFAYYFELRLALGPEGLGNQLKDPDKAPCGTPDNRDNRDTFRMIPRATEVLRLSECQQV